MPPAVPDAKVVARTVPRGRGMRAAFFRVCPLPECTVEVEEKAEQRETAGIPGSPYPQDKETVVIQTVVSDAAYRKHYRERHA